MRIGNESGYIPLGPEPVPDVKNVQLDDEQKEQPTPEHRQPEDGARPKSDDREAGIGNLVDIEV